MPKSKVVLMVLGAVILVMGLLTLLGVDLGATEPVWHTWVKVVVGAAAVYIGYAEK